jgi:hypothetical protein
MCLAGRVGGTCQRTERRGVGQGKGLWLWCEKPLAGWQGVPETRNWPGLGR